MLRASRRALIELMILDYFNEGDPWIEKRNKLLELASHDERARTNNRITNLRVVTPNENVRNSPLLGYYQRKWRKLHVV